MIQAQFPFEKAGGVVPFDPPVSTLAEKVRLSKQCQKILDLLRIRDVTNKELSGIALSYTRRISDLREAGYRVKISKRDHETGLTEYHLEKRNNASV